MKRTWRVLLIVILALVSVLSGSGVARLTFGSTDLNTISLAISLSMIAALTIVISDLLGKQGEVGKSLYTRVAIYGFIVALGLQFVLRYISTT